MSENNNKKIIAIVIAVIAFIAIIWGFYYSYRINHQKEEFNPLLESPRGTEGAMETIDAKHQYKGGTHTYAGEINLRTPCDVVEVKAEKDTMDPHNIKLAFTSSSTGDVCTQVVTPRRWKASVEAPADVNVTGTLNGAEAKLNIFEVPAGENLDTFEVNIKG